MRQAVIVRKDIEHAANKAKERVKKLKESLAVRKKAIEERKAAIFRSQSNLNTMYGASNGVFDRLPVPKLLNRGALAHTWYAPEKRQVPLRLQTLEDERLTRRRRLFARKGMGKTYNSQLHGQSLGVAAAAVPSGADAAASFIEMSSGEVHDAPPMRELPPQ